MGYFRAEFLNCIAKLNRTFSDVFNFHNKFFWWLRILRTIFSVFYSEQEFSERFNMNFSEHFVNFFNEMLQSLNIFTYLFIASTAFKIFHRNVHLYDIWGLRSKYLTMWLNTIPKWTVYLENILLLWNDNLRFFLSLSLFIQNLFIVLLFHLIQYTYVFPFKFWISVSCINIQHIMKLLDC